MFNVLSFGLTAFSSRCAQPMPLAKQSMRRNKAIRPIFVQLMMRRYKSHGRHPAHAVGATSSCQSRLGGLHHHYVRICFVQASARPPSARRLATKQTFEITHSLLEFSNARGADHILIGLHGCMPALDHATLPSKQLRGCDASTSCDERHAHARLHGFFHQPDLLGSRPSAAALHRGETSNREIGPSEGIVIVVIIAYAYALSAMPSVRSKKGAVQ